MAAGAGGEDDVLISVYSVAMHTDGGSGCGLPTDPIVFVGDAGTDGRKMCSFSASYFLSKKQVMADDEWSPYPDPNRPPPPPDASVVSHYARMNPLGRALAKALTSLAEDDELGIDIDSSYAPSHQQQGKTDERKDGEEQSDDDSTGEKRGRKRSRRKVGDDDSSTTDNDEQAAAAKVSVDDKMKEHLLQSFGDAVAETDWYGQNNVEEGKSLSTTNKSHLAPNAPSGLLRGKVKHYNRFGRQWRILAEDVEIRPRVRLEKDGRVRRRGHQKRSERQSLWERSLEHDEEQIQAVADTDEAAGEAAGDSADPASAVAASSSSNGPDLEGLDVEGNTVRIKGDVLILAYDDV